MRLILKLIFRLTLKLTERRCKNMNLPNWLKVLLQAISAMVGAILGGAI